LSSTDAQPQPKIFYHAVEEDSSSKATFLVISNDNTERNLIWLVCLKEIFAKQLPKMPREYIVRLLFDRQHQSLLCLEGDQVVGGISFKPYPEQRFGEIAFCAVSATHQVKGFGTRLMNHLKEYVKRVNLTHFLTYADNFAIGYFKKQGFSSSISMPKERWVGYIKDYDGGTLMKCVINPSIDYFHIPRLIKRQRAYLLDRITQAKHLQQDQVYPGLNHMLKAPLHHIDDPYTQIPGLKEAGWTRPILQPQQQNSNSSNITPVAAVARALISGVAGAELQSALRGVVDQVASHKDSWPFHEPVPPSVVDYLDVVTEPIDLSLIRARVNSLQYTLAGSLRRDLQLMLDNCRTYNRPDTTYYRAAQGLQKLVNDIFGDIPIVERSTQLISSSSSAVSVA
jgi:histone acetyltransferase